MQKVEKSQIYIERAFNNSQRSSGLMNIKGKTRLERTVRREIHKIELFAKDLIDELKRIADNFPDEDVSEFYAELLKTTVDMEKARKAISSFRVVAGKINEVEKNHENKFKTCKNIDEIEKIKKEFYGKTISYVKKLDGYFVFMESIRFKIRNFPSIKTGLFTVCISGLPNVGKSTLLSKITTAKPEIKPYAFTTKSLMLGYIGKIQIIDTPGTFKEMLKKMNMIEKQSYLALKYLADLIIYVFDITESCGFLVSDQEELYDELKNYFKEKEIIVYISKNDIIEDEKIKEFLKRKGIKYAFYSPESIKEYIIKKGTEDKIEQ